MYQNLQSREMLRYISCRFALNLYDRPEFVFEEQLADQTREQLLHILGYQYCAEKCKLAAIARTERLEAEARKDKNVYKPNGTMTDFGRASITNFFQTKL